MSVPTTEFTSPDSNVSPYAHAVRHLDEAEELAETHWAHHVPEYVKTQALLGIGWALLAIARKR